MASFAKTVEIIELIMKRSLDTSTMQRSLGDLDLIADPTLSMIMDSNVLDNTLIRLPDVTSLEKIHLHVRGYYAYWGGYAEHLRSFVFKLAENSDYEIKITPIASPINIDPTIMARMGMFFKNHAFNIEKSIFLNILGPGWMQDDEKFIPQDGRYKIGWTMVETKEVQKEILDWLNNLDEVWAPTDMDVRRFRSHRNVCKMHLGYDEKRYNTKIKPLDIVNLRGKYVFGVFGSWNKRKGVKLICRAFCKAFRGNGRVALFLMCRFGNRPYDESKGFCGKELRKKEDLSKWTVIWELNAILKELKEEMGEDFPQIT